MTVLLPSRDRGACTFRTPNRETGVVRAMQTREAAVIIMFLICLSHLGFFTPIFPYNFTFQT